MSSSPSPEECFVYITLPGATEPVTSGRFSLETDRNGVPLGRFVYGRSYLARADAVEFDPVELRLLPQVFETTALNGVFGALRDAGPDFWGRRVIERHAGKAQLGELDYLLHSPDDRAGALGFGLNQTPPAPLRTFNRTIDLAKLQAIADAVAADEKPESDADMAQIEELLLVATSMGGARPKAVVEDAEGLWIAKFNRYDDRWNNARVEHAMLLLGRAAGLTTAESRIASVGGRDVLLVKRFDREKTEAGYLRARMISGLTLLRADESAGGRDRWSYVLLVEELRRASAAPDVDARELFRRMCFNALISNTDDHPRNHALIAKNRDWRLSPAYDLTPSPVISQDRRDLAMAIGAQGRLASAENLTSESARFLLPKAAAEAVVAAMEACVHGRWYEVARAAGVSDRDCGLIAGAFVHPGFRRSKSQRQRLAAPRAGMKINL
ncbi:MAG TPA: HipA domain-containing protein [Caulobacteraceae bacterium]|nr:HipA domain-containing protein [Caulobacteraceae bacterium]